MTQDNSAFLGFDKKQIPILALLAAVGGILIAFGGIIIALQIGLRSDMNANHAALRADIHALDSRVDALRAEFREDIRALDSRIDALAVEAAETNARIENIERSLPQYASVDERIDRLERELARLNELVKALTNPE